MAYYIIISRMAIRPESKELLEQMMVVVNGGDGMGVKNFVLKGPIVDAPIALATFFGLFPDLTGERREFALVKLNPAVDTTDIYKKVLELEVPQRIKALAIQEDRPLRISLERRFACQGLPTLMVAFGRIKDTQEEVAILFTILGYTPHQALREIKEIVRQRQIRLS